MNNQSVLFRYVFKAHQFKNSCFKTPGLNKIYHFNDRVQKTSSSVGIVFMPRASRCMKQCVEPTIRKSCFILATNPLNLPVYAGAPSIQKERKFFQDSPFCSKVLDTDTSAPTKIENNLVHERNCSIIESSLTII